MNSYTLAMDIGTSSVRAALYDANADAVPETFVKNERRLSETDDGGAELDATEALSQVETAIDEVLAKSADRRIELAAASSFWHSLVGIDRDGNPTTKVFAWAENRPSKYVAELRKTFVESAIHNRTGAHFHSSFWPAKLLWLQREQPEAFARTTHWISFSDLVLLRFCGKLRTSVSMASATGIFDQRRCCWDDEIINFLGLNVENFSTIVASDLETFGLSEDYAKRWPRLANTRWLPAIGDGAANNIGASCVSRDKAALMIGTSGAMRVAYEGEVPETIPDGLWCYRIDRRRVIIGGALSDGGGLYRWLKDNLRLNGTDDDIESEIATRAPAAHGLTFLPFLFGERSTGYHENARGAVIGLRAATDSIDIVRAGLESVAYRFADILDRLNQVVEIREIVASGGALRESPVWTQIIADVLGRDLFLPDTREASSRGAVLFASEIFGVNSSKSTALPLGSHYRCNIRNRSTYEEARNRHRSLYERISA
ncbi:MAG: gluconokinase [Acidobacteria bacterium]|nr:gluconokinase [Acidobacteriota bacterium]